jgi:hypothetical protein
LFINTDTLTRFISLDSFHFINSRGFNLVLVSRSRAKLDGVAADIRAAAVKRSEASSDIRVVPVSYIFLRALTL